MQPEDIQDDIVRLDHGDPELKKALESVRMKYKAKGLPYRELLGSKFYGTVKYLLQEMHDKAGTVLITDLDTNNTYRFVDEQQVRRVDNVQEWIKSQAA